MIDVCTQVPWGWHYNDSLCRMLDACCSGIQASFSWYDAGALCLMHWVNPSTRMVAMGVLGLSIALHACARSPSRPAIRLRVRSYKLLSEGVSEARLECGTAWLTRMKNTCPMLTGPGLLAQVQDHKCGWAVLTRMNTCPMLTGPGLLAQLQAPARAHQRPH